MEASKVIECHHAHTVTALQRPGDGPKCEPRKQLGLCKPARVSKRHSRQDCRRTYGTARGGFVTLAFSCWTLAGALAKGARKIRYAGYRFPLEVIDQAIWLYLRSTLSFRDVENLVAERGSRSPTKPCAAG